METEAQLTADAGHYDAAGSGKGPFAWYRQISASEKRAFWSCKIGYVLDAMDTQFLSFVIPTLIATWGITLADAGFKVKLAELGLEPYASTPAEFGKFIADNTEKWSKVIRDAKIPQIQ